MNLKPICPNFKVKCQYIPPTWCKHNTGAVLCPQVQVNQAVESVRTESLLSMNLRGRF